MGRREEGGDARRGEKREEREEVIRSKANKKREKEIGERER